MNDVIDQTEHRDIDALLSRHFRSQMPDPWPACEALAQARKAGRRRNRARSLGRLALAASVVLFFAAYLTVAALFPPQQAKPGSDPNSMATVPHRPTTLHHK